MQQERLGKLRNEDGRQNDLMACVSALNKHTVSATPPAMLSPTASKNKRKQNNIRMTSNRYTRLPVRTVELQLCVSGALYLLSCLLLQGFNVTL